MKIILVLTILIFGALTGCGGGDSPKDIPNGSVELSRKQIQRTAGGARVFSENGVSQNQLNLIETGLTTRAEAAQADGLTLGLNTDFYEIYIPKQSCEPSPEQRIPSFKVRADNYDGTEFDQYNPRGQGVKDGIGVVFAAEMILSYGGQMVACSDEQYLAEAVGNGLDHIALAQNPEAYADGANYFNCTITHTVYGHPLLPRAGRCQTSGLIGQMQKIKEKQIIDPVK